MRYCARLWDRMEIRFQREILRIPFNNVEYGLLETKTKAVKRATELADSEHHRRYSKLLQHVSARDASIATTELTIITMEHGIREFRSRLGALQVQRDSASTVLEVSSREHRLFTDGYRTHQNTQSPKSGTSVIMPPPRTHVPLKTAPAHDVRPSAPSETRAPPAPSDDRTTSSDTWAVAAS